MTLEAGIKFGKFRHFSAFTKSEIYIRFLSKMRIIIMNDEQKSVEIKVLLPPVLCQAPFPEVTNDNILVCVLIYNSPPSFKCLPTNIYF